MLIYVLNLSMCHFFQKGFEVAYIKLYDKEAKKTQI